MKAKSKRALTHYCYGLVWGGILVHISHILWVVGLCVLAAIGNVLIMEKIK